MASLILRLIKGSPLTNAEVDGNFSALNTELATKITASSADTLTNKVLDDISNEIGANHLHFKVKATENLVAGDVVKVTGYNAGENAYEVAKMTATTDVAIGIIDGTIAIGGFGAVVNTGLLEGFDTSAFTVGQILYPNGTGGLTATQPTSGTYQAIAFVLRSHAVNGAALVEASEPTAVRTSSNTGNTVVLRDASGNFSAGTITAALSGNATTATSAGKWTTARTLSFTGDATGSGSVDGSINVATSLTLANSGVTAGVYGSSTNIPQITVDAKGRLTTVSNVAVSIPSGALTFTGDVSGTGTTGSTTTLTLANSGVTAGTYGSSTAIPSLTIDAKGRVTSASTSSISVGNGTLTLAVSGTGLSGSQTFTANQGTNATFTVTSNATSANTASTIVARDASGNFSAGTITATLSGSATSAGYLTGGDSAFYAYLYNSNSGDLNAYNSPGLYSSEYTGSTNNPAGATGQNGHWIQISDAGGTDVKTQWYYHNGGSDISMRLMWGNGAWKPWRKLLHDGNYNSYAPTLTGGGASGTWGISITGNAATASSVAWTNVSGRPTAVSSFSNDSGYITSSSSISGSAGSVSGLTLTSSANGINPDSVTQNQIGYNTSVSLFGQTDGGLYSSAYSSSWIHQIYGDFRTGQIAIRGKNSGTWQAWRTVLDSSNYTSYTASRNSSGYLTPNNWIQLNGFYGLYAPDNGAHFYPNNLTYGSWRVAGSRNSWYGLEFDSGVRLMMNADSHGFHNTTRGWAFYNEAGNGYFPGNVTAYWSDERLKENLRRIDREALEILSHFRAHRYNWNARVKDCGIPIEVGKEEIGLIAQHVQRSLADAVVVNKAANSLREDGSQEATDYLTINYDRITPLLVEAANIHEEDIASLQAKVARLEALVETLIGD